jgi:hypothetical protein
MTARSVTKFVQVGDYGAAVSIERIESETGWAPYLRVEDALKLDAVRDDLRTGDLRAAAAVATVYRLVPIAV